MKVCSTYNCHFRIHFRKVKINVLYFYGKNIHIDIFDDLSLTCHSLLSCFSLSFGMFSTTNHEHFVLFSKFRFKWMSLVNLYFSFLRIQLPVLKIELLIKELLTWEDFKILSLQYNLIGFLWAYILTVFIL